MVFGVFSSGELLVLLFLVALLFSACCDCSLACVFFWFGVSFTCFFFCVCVFYFLPQVLRVFSFGFWCLKEEKHSKSSYSNRFHEKLYNPKS